MINNMIPLEYGYLFASSILLIPWVILYALRPDERREMVNLSLFMGLASVITAYFWWTHDWWAPLTVSGTRVGIEDFIVGFAAGGTMSSVYEVIWRRKHFRYARSELFYVPAWALLMVCFVSIELLTHLSTITSFVASSLVMFIVGVFYHISRPDLLRESILSGTLMVLVASIFFYLPLVIFSPEWIAQTYLWSYLSGIPIFGVPIEEFIFWFMAGFVFGPWYEYWKHERLRRIAVFVK